MREVSGDEERSTNCLLVRVIKWKMRKKLEKLCDRV
jgi:hypothetical protein